MTSEQIQTLIQNFSRRRIRCEYFKHSADLLNWLTSELPKNSTIGIGDSVTMEETGVFSLLRSSDYALLDKYDPTLTKDNKKKLYRENFSADAFFLGANGISMTGEIVQIDGNGSRLAPMIYGPDKVYIIAGTNKIAPTLEEAKKRARQIAGPLDAKRLNKKTPCATTGTCIDCQSPERICNTFVTLSGQFDPERVTVCLIEGNFGY